MPSANLPASEPVCHIVTPVGMFGYGLDEQELQDTLASFSASPAPTAIILDSGSTDSGPRKLAEGDMTCPRSSYLRDFRKILHSAKKFHVPILISSAGGDGTDAHVRVIEEVVQEVVSESDQDLKVVSIFANIDRSLVHARLASGDIAGCGATVPALTQSDVATATQIVAQMGPEPYLAAMRAHPDYELLLGGRSNDPAPYVAFATAAFQGREGKRGNPSHPTSTATSNGGGLTDGVTDGLPPLTERVAGGIQHMGKILECGGACAKPKSRGVAATVFGDGSFEIVPTDPAARCTPVSVAAHTLYETGRPDVIAGPGGWLELGGSAYEQLDDGRTVRVRGGVYKRSLENGRPYQVKLEGARNIGFRCMYMGVIRDPILIAQLDGLLERAKLYAQSQVDGLRDGTWDLDFHVHGRGTSEVFLVGEAVAETRSLASAIVSTAKIATIHGSYPGQKATGGNFAFGIGGIPKLECGSCCEFCVYHLMNLEPGEEVSLFPIEARTFQGGSKTGTMRNGSLPEDKAKAHSDQKMKHSFTVAASPPEILPRDAVTLSDVAKVLRSKNAGPYEITLDVMFDRPEIFAIMRDSNLLSAEVVAQLYDLNVEEVLWSGWFGQALAFKATIPRKRRGLAVSNGGFMENDMHGSQMYMPLFNLKLPESLRQKLATIS